MVILITGAPHTGKTLLAQRLIEKLHYPCLSIDHLKMGLIRSGNTALTPEDDEALTKYLWPIVREMVKTAIENKQNLIIEGCYIPFDWRRNFNEKYLQAIQFVCLAMSDAYIEAHFEEIKAHACDIEARLDDSSCTVERLQADNRAFREGFEQSGEHILLMESDFLQTVDSLLEEETTR
jgi:adenylate kinase family enzyme